MNSRKLLLLCLTVLALVAAFARADVVELNPENFRPIVEDPRKDVFVLFYAPWCGHCNAMKPQWHMFGKQFPVTGDVIVAMVDASTHRDIGAAHGVTGFPTIKLFTKDDKSGMTYEGPRTIGAWESFLKTHLTY